MRLGFILFFMAFLMCSCTEKKGSGKIPDDPALQQVPEWSKGVVWYQIFPERFRNGDPGNDPVLADQAGCWPHELTEPWEVHPWETDWYALQNYEKAVGKDLGYNLTRRRYGGDLQGVIDQLDYLEDLGIGAIYMNPVFVSPSHHKYDIANYHHIDPNFGPDPAGDRQIIEAEIPDDPASWLWTSADKLALQLIEKAHEKGIRIIFDGVFNHVGYNHFAIADVKEKQQDSRFKDWFNIRSWDDPEAGTAFDYEGWWGIKDMPELKEDEHGIVKGPKQYIFDITERWMDPYGKGDLSKGIDGWRLDVAFEVGHPFWKDWRKHVRGINPDAYLVAEVIDTPGKLKPYLEGDEFDAVMNYNFDFICSEFFINKDISPSKFDTLLRELRNAFSEDVGLAMQNLLGSHDTDRPSSRVKNKGIASFLEWGDYFGIGKSDNPKYLTGKPSKDDYQLLKLMIAFQMCYPGSPMIYYGDEVGMWGAGDPDCRKPMLWKDIKYDNERTDAKGTDYPVGNEVYPDIEFLDYYKKLIRIRKQHPALVMGNFREIVVDDSSNIYAFRRSYEADTIIAIFNNSEDNHQVLLEEIKDGHYVNAIDGKTYSTSGGHLNILLQPHKAAILTVAP